MSKVRGVVEKVYDNGPSKGRFGTQYRISIVVDGEKYSGFFRKDAEDLGIEEGSYVSFKYTENGQYKNIDVKTFECSEGADGGGDDDDTPPRGAPARKGAPTSGGKPNIDRNIARGQAVNNAVLLFVHGKAPDLRAALKQAIELHAVAEHFFDKLLAGVEVGTALKAPPSAATASEDEGGTTPAPAGRKGKAAPAKPAASKKKATPPPPPPDDDPDDDDQGGDGGSDGFDDDVPFE